jgi:hypothetical protein
MISCGGMNNLELSTMIMLATSAGRRRGYRENIRGPIPLKFGCATFNDDCGLNFFES